MVLSPAAERGREVRLRLLSAAVELIPERGWSAVSTRVLAERAGVTPSVVHYHFPSIQAVLHEAVVSAMGSVLGEFEPMLQAGRDAGDLVDALAGTVERYTGADPMSLLFVEAYLAATRDDLLRERIAEVVEGFHRRLTGFLSRYGVPAPGETAVVLAAAVDGLLLHRALSPRAASAPVAAVLRRVVECAEGEGS